MKILGHGGCIYEVENTIKSFERAFELGADGVELDTQSSSSGTRGRHLRNLMNVMTYPKYGHIDGGAGFGSSLQVMSERHEGEGKSASLILWQSM